MKTTPFWYKLIYNWVINRSGSGLTLPYLLGALHYVNKTLEPEQRIVSILNDMTDTELPFVISFKVCNNIGENVFGFIDRKQFFSMGKYLSPNLFLAPSVTNNKIAKKRKELSDYCLNNYSDPIKCRNFSLVNHVWQPFQEEDYSFIKHSLSINI